MNYKFNMVTIGADANIDGTAEELLKLLSEGGEIINTVSFAAGSRYIIKTPVEESK